MKNISKTFICPRPTLGTKVSLRQMTKENHLHLQVLSQIRFEISGSQENMNKMMASRGWKQTVSIDNIKLG